MTLAPAGTGKGTVLWIAAAVLAVLSVLVINGRPLFYFDTIGYVDQGRDALMQLGLAEAPRAAGAGGGVAAGVEAVRTVDGSRSAFYSLLAGVLSQAGLLEGLLVFNALGLFLSVWLLARVAGRVHAPDRSWAAMVCLPLIAASLGSLPFYAAYLMPDLFAPVMILTLAMVTAFGRDMRWWELVLAYMLAAVAVVSHLSHFAIAGLIFLAMVVISPLIGRRRWWLAPVFGLAVLGAAWAQQAAFRVVAEKAANSEVVIKPFITARLIQDGPGLDWLNDHCPDAGIPTCALHEALQLSDDPYRLTASHIIFETSERLGSFRLMTPENQKAVADAQRDFFLAVLRDKPVATMLAFLKNTAVQSAMVSVDMTLPSQNMVMRNADVTGALSGPLTQGRLGDGQGWLTPVVAVQAVLYIAALVVIAAALLRPVQVPWAVKGFAVMVLLGLLANAFVCGGISQPATRYGARVIWLLPFLAAFLWFWLRPAKGRTA